MQKITIATLRNGLSLNFTLWNIESAAKPIQKTIATHAWVHLIFQSVDFRAFAVNVKTIASKKYLYQFGHAIWHGQAPRIINTFLEGYDFSGKTIVPFCTSHSSGIGSSAEDLHDLCSDSTEWNEGKRFEAGTSKEEIEEWLKSM